MDPFDDYSEEEIKNTLDEVKLLKYIENDLDLGLMT